MRYDDFIKEYDRLFTVEYEINIDDYVALDMADKAAALMDSVDGWNVVQKSEGQRKVVVSLTTIPERINCVKYSILCMLIQTYQVDAVYLWLDESRFDENRIPNSLVELCNGFLNIRYVKDIGPYTKYYYAFKEFNEDIVITIDDDTFYPRDTVAGLMETHRKYPDAVCARWILDMKTTSNGIPYPMSTFTNVTANHCAVTKETYLAQGVGGVLYEPSKMDEECYNEELFCSLAPRTDDIWLKAIEVKSGLKVVQVQSDHRFVFPMLARTQKVALRHNNLIDGNDVAIKAVFKHFDIRLDGVNETVNKNKLTIMREWVKVYQQGKRISDYLVSRGIRNVAIYGFSWIGDLVCEDLMEGPVKVSYAVDKNKERIKARIPLYRLEEQLPQVEAVLITAAIDINDIDMSFLPVDRNRLFYLEDILIETLFDD